jgi:hypothetical protein
VIADVCDEGAEAIFNSTLRMTHCAAWRPVLLGYYANGQGEMRTDYCAVYPQTGANGWWAQYSGDIVASYCYSNYCASAARAEYLSFIGYNYGTMGAGNTIGAFASFNSVVDTGSSTNSAITPESPAATTDSPFIN